MGGDFLEPIQFMRQDGREFFSRIGVVQLPVPYRTHVRQDFLVVGGSESETARSAEELAIGEEIDKQEAEQLKQDFDRYLSEIEQEWKWFEGHQNKFKSLRDQKLAHLDVAKAGQKYELKKAPGPEWKTVKEAMEHLINTGELLLTLLCKESHSFDQAVELSRKDAQDYWECT